MENKEWERLLESLMKEGVLRSSKVISSMRALPREKFLPQDMQLHAADDTPLPIGFGQTISAPHRHSDVAWLGETWFH